MLTYNAVCDYVYKDEANSGSKYLLITNHEDDFDGQEALYCPIRSKMFVRKKRALVNVDVLYLDIHTKSMLFIRAPNSSIWKIMRSLMYCLSILQIKGEMFIIVIKTWI
jgi:hypothetical protein